MKKFNFSLESLLTLRDLEEQKAKSALSQINAQVEQMERSIQELDASVSGAYDSWDGQSGRRFNAMDRLSLGAQVADLQAKRQQSEQRLQEMLDGRKRAMLALQKATRNRKVVTNLKEKRLKEYQAELFKQEANEIEDVFNARRRAK